VITSIVTALALFVVWVLLSGKMDAAHLGAGALIAAAIALATRQLWALSPVFGASAAEPFAGLRWGRFLRYLVVLAWEIVVSAVQVAYVVLHPRMPIDPRLLRFRSHLPHPLARLTLANSITLTPGTVTIEVEGDEFLVHALTPGSAKDVELGGLRNWVAALFDAPPSRQTSGARS
jgi:multicomponent Na+:H+ antiporter subunit E